MVTHTVIISDRSKDNITVYTKEPAFLVIADRTDLKALKYLEEANKAGIYILLGENQRYVGQASNKIYERLAAHHLDENKSWWNQIIFFGREDGHLDKSQTDYLEKRLIEEFKKTELQLDNNTVGNRSYIEKTSKIKADNIWNLAQEIMDEVAHINIFETTITDEENSTGQYFIELEGHKILGKSYRDNQKQFFLFLLKNSRYRKLVEEFCLNGKPSGNHCIGNEPSFRPNGMKYTTELTRNIYLYHNLSMKDLRKSIQNFADAVGLKIIFHWD
ncbi:GIY-YIG nuclease family protein [Glaesserella parasuis]|uniref:GIY-YIG nuclease family protein n=1 Tax=Glaesserella parasuis TaxID=738 RepID=UPI0003ABD352|nr:GIY-YIG nuclease family protein [Glaesserella parasuis]EQA07999.1 GIY-YIG catalytic domain protein [Glaesserella parasuis H465]MCT8556950.1 GIY-YIG nuclease family protein [Glaesserella parasuis]MCT8566637.1 GIY-YIG nuclease family protein [Glaesserella parasuis]MCT8680418.1 GIY-YIG nuclease family protein [Glaesserella parasuis]MCT8781268.1 GIY-YIG nuclease family protein [Glaesserella parasuis]